MRTETHDAFADPEQRYRRRYVDLTVNDQVKKHLSREPKCSMQCVLSLMKGYLEVETPVCNRFQVLRRDLYHAPQLLGHAFIHAYCQ
jgi:lysyl-tRNA synthetase class II